MVTFMDKSEIAKLAPSVFASKPCDRMSDRYSFVPSASIVDQFDALGWGVTRALQPKSYKRSGANKKHTLGFQRKDLSLRIADPRNPSQDIFLRSSSPTPAMARPRSSWPLACLLWSARMVWSSSPLIWAALRSVT